MCESRIFLRFVLFSLLFIQRIKCIVHYAVLHIKHINFYLFIVVCVCLSADAFDLIYLRNRFTHVDNFSTIITILNGKIPKGDDFH